MYPIRLASLTLLAAAMAACSSMPPNNAMLDQARSDYHQAQANSQTQTLAPVELKQAGDALARAEAAFANHDDTSQVNQLPTCRANAPRWPVKSPRARARKRRWPQPVLSATSSCWGAHARGRPGHDDGRHRHPGCGQFTARVRSLTAPGRSIATAGWRRRASQSGPASPAARTECQEDRPRHGRDLG